ncbi:hypothetical protein SEPCBS119000_001282 [Sporothrix epigloea]|uniref:RNase III domain-containing protein n=1 Tax=Sporothrix epigloea TaxID=1892477 RepID=A0ABP0DAY4_9PEZI
MSKRPLSDDDVGDAGASKRHKASPAIPSEKLALLQNYYKKLKGLVKAVENGSPLEDPLVLKELIASNKLVLPLLESLGDESSRNSTSNGETSMPFATVPTIHGLPYNLVPYLKGMSAWRLEDISESGYPPLPPIPDVRLEQMALTHSGKNGHWNYETLEFLGDSFIYHVSSEIITQTFPELTPGRKSQIREGLLRNSNLAKYAQHYGIDKRAHLPPEFYGMDNPGSKKMTGKERQKVHGDLFEAYVGALIRARPPPGQGSPDYDGVTVALEWLRLLWAVSLSKDITRKYQMPHLKQQRLPSAAQQPQTPRSVQPPSDNVAGASASSMVAPPTTNLTQSECSETTQAAASVPPETAEGEAAAQPQRLLSCKVRLSGQICCKEIRLRYEDAPKKKTHRDRHSKMPMFTVAVWVDCLGTSECLGYGTALSKKAAGEKAAGQALENKTKMKYYVAQKARLHDARVAAAAAVAAEGVKEEVRAEEVRAEDVQEDVLADRHV